MPLDREDCFRPMVDVQEHLSPAVVERGRVAANARYLVAAARRLRVPVLMTEHRADKMVPSFPSCDPWYRKTRSRPRRTLPPPASRPAPSGFRSWHAPNALLGAWRLMFACSGRRLARIPWTPHNRTIETCSVVGRQKCKLWVLAIVLVPTFRYRQVKLTTDAFSVTDYLDSACWGRERCNSDPPVRSASQYHRKLLEPSRSVLATKNAGSEVRGGTS